MSEFWNRQSTTSRGYLIALAGTAIWSTTAIIIRHLNDSFGMSAMAVAFWRDFWVALLLWGVFTLFNRPLLRLPRREYRFLFGYGLFLAIFNSLWTISVSLNGAAIATVLIYSSAAFTALYERWFQGVHLGPRKGLAIVLSLLGSALTAEVHTAAAWQVNPWGLAVGLLSGIAFSGYSLLGNQAAKRGINSWTALVYSFSVAVFFLGVLNFLEMPFSLSATIDRLSVLGTSWQGWGWMILLAAIPSIGGYGLYTLSLRYLRASVSNLIATLEPSMTAALAYVLLGERFTPAQIAGSILILGGVVILRYEGGNS
jgi:drug/metabolite transporter (DMT)-like permease